MAGRATKLTPEIQDRIAQAVKTGMFQNRAARMAGVHESTFYRWMERGRADPATEPDLNGLPTKTLQARCKQAGIDLPRRATRDAMIAALNDAGEGSWDVFRQFCDAIEQAEIECEQALIAQWRLQAPENWKAIESFLARRFKHWHPAQHVELSGPEGEPIPVSIRAQNIAKAAAAFREGTDE